MKSLFLLPLLLLGLSSRLINSIEIGSPIISLDYSPNGNFIAMGGANKVIDIYQPDLGVKVKTLTNGHTDDVLTVRFSPDSRLIATGGVDHRILIWDVASGRIIREMHGHTDYVRDLSFSPDGFYLASASWDGTAIMWETGTGRIAREFKKHPDNVTSVAFSPTGNHIVTACGDHKLRVFNTKDGTMLRSMEGHTDEIWDVKWSSASGVVASCGWDNKARIWNANHGKPVGVLPGHVTDVWSVAFSPDGTMLGTSGGDRTVKLWDLPTGKHIMTLAAQAHNSDVEEIAFNPEGSVLASCGRDGFVKFWRVPLLEERLVSSVDVAIESWKKKGKFEKTADYEKRLGKADNESRRVRNELEKQLVQFFEANVNWEESLVIDEYDADNESFRIISPVLGQLRLIVKPNDAEKVAENMERIEFRDLKMKIVKGKMQVDSITAYLKGLNRRYTVRP